MMVDTTFDNEARRDPEWADRVQQLEVRTGDVVLTITETESGGLVLTAVPQVEGVTLSPNVARTGGNGTGPGIHIEIRTNAVLVAG